MRHTGSPYDLGLEKNAANHVALSPLSYIERAAHVYPDRVAIVLVLGTGLWMIGNVAKHTVQSGGSFAMPLSWTVMATLGLVMMAIFGHIRFALFKRLQRAVAATDWAAGGKALASIRSLVALNLGLGVLTVAVALLA